MKSIAVLLTVHNRKEKTLCCLRNLFNQQVLNGYQVEVYLTDDGCNDGTPEAIQTQYPQVHIVQGDGHLFWNRGMYAAWETASKAKDYDFYLWLNDDTFVYPYMLKSLLQASNEKKDQAIIIGATQSSNKAYFTYGGRLKKGTTPVPNGSLLKVEFFNGNIVLVPREVFNALGNLDPYFSHSKGDFDYGLREKKAGIEMYQAGRYLGECDLHPKIDKWCDPAIPFHERWIAMKRPTGMPPKEIYHLNLRHKGLTSAVIHFLTVYIRCIFPQLWIRRNKKFLDKQISKE